MNVLEKIRKQVETNPVIIYMKGTPQMPQCGFSANASAALTNTGLPFAYVNVLEDPWIYEKLPSFADWPTFPQIFVGGELLGGSDIVVAMSKEGSLKPVVEAAIAKSENE